MRVVVTGATGMIGSAVCTALLERGDEVVGLTRDRKPAMKKRPEIEWHSWWADTELAPNRALENSDAVVNLIGESINQRLTQSAKKRIRASRITATENLVRGIAAADQSPDILVSQSAIGFYGDTGDRVVDESTPSTDPGFLTQVTRDWEAAALTATEHGVRVAVIRSGHVLTSEGGFLGELLPPFKFGLGGPIAGGRQYVSWIHIADTIGITLLALDNAAATGPLNSTAPGPVTNREFSKTLGNVLDRPAIMPIPSFALWPLKGREMAAAIATGQRVLPTRPLELGYSFKFPELEPALRDLLDR